MNNILNRILIEWNNSDTEDSGLIKASDTSQYIKYRFFPKCNKELLFNIVAIIKEAYNTEKQRTEKNPIDLNIIDVSKITSFCNLFFIVKRTLNNEGVPESAWKWIDVSKWNVSNADNMAQMFANCEHLCGIGDLSRWDVSNVRAMNYMFDSCHNLKSLGNLSKWDVSNVGILSAEDLLEDDPEQINTMRGMFEDCYKLEYIGDISKWNMIIDTDISYMFLNCKSLSWIGDDLTELKLKLRKKSIRNSVKVFENSALCGKIGLWGY